MRRDPGAYIAWAVVILLIGAMAWFAGWALIEIPRAAAERAVCYERGGVFVYRAYTIDGEIHPGCVRPVVSIPDPTPTEAP